MKIEESKIDIDDIEKCRIKEKEYIKSKFNELIGKHILIKDRWSEQQFKVFIDSVKEVDLPFPRQCIVKIRWLDGKEEQCIGSSFYKKLTWDESIEILDLKTKEIVLTSEAHTERKLNNYNEDDVIEKRWHDQIIEGTKFPALHRIYEIAG